MSAVGLALGTVSDAVGAVSFGLDTVIVAAIGAMATLYGIREARAGRHDAVIQQAAANKLAKEKQELDTLRTVIVTEREEVDRANIQRDAAREEADQERQRRLLVENELRADAERERNRRIELETALRLSELQAARAATRHADEYGALLVLVRGEVMREAGRTELLLEQSEKDDDLGESMSGACAGGQHHACPVVLQKRECSCDCHTVVAQ